MLVSDEALELVEQRGVLLAYCVDQVGQKRTRRVRTTREKSAKQARHTIYKPAPETAQVGDVMAVSEEEWVKLAAVLSPDPTEIATSAPPKAASPTSDDIRPLEPPAKSPSLADRIQKMWKK